MMKRENMKYNKKDKKKIRESWRRRIERRAIQISYTDACYMRKRQEDLGLCEDTGL